MRSWHAVYWQFYVTTQNVRTETQPRSHFLPAITVEQRCVRTDQTTKIREAANINSFVMLDVPPDGDCFFHVLAFQLNRTMKPRFAWTAKKLRELFHATLISFWNKGIRDLFIATLGCAEGEPDWRTFDTSKVQNQLTKNNTIVPLDLQLAVLTPRKEFANNFMIQALFCRTPQFKHCELDIVNYNPKNQQFSLLRVKAEGSEAKHVLRFIHGNGGDYATYEATDLEFLKNHYLALLTAEEWKAL